MIPRLKQPLFQEASQASCKKVPMLADLVRAYDSIWTLLYRPDDIALDARHENARVVLNSLGLHIEAHCGPDPFEFDPAQLTFPDEILHPTQPARLTDEAAFTNFKLK